MTNNLNFMFTVRRIMIRIKLAKLNLNLLLCH